MEFASLTENHAPHDGPRYEEENIWTHGRKVLLFFEQVLIMCQKHLSQKKRNGRQFLKDSIMIQFFMLAFTTFIIFQSATYYPSPHVYDRIPLPPLSKSAANGIFNQDSPGNEANYQLSKRLYYAPDNHAGVNALIAALTNLYPDVEVVGAADAAGINSIYENNLFDTWASLDFQLTSDQITTGQLITSQTQPSSVAYTISINPSIWGNLPTSNYTEPIKNKEVGPADLFWSSGYLTLQNFVDEFLVQQYNGAESFSVRSSHTPFPFLLLSSTCSLSGLIVGGNIRTTLPFVSYLREQNTRQHLHDSSNHLEMDRWNHLVDLSLCADHVVSH